MHTLWTSMAFCIATSMAQVLLLVVMTRKGLRKYFPIFFAYNAVYAATNVLLTLVDLTLGSTSLYFYLYWILNAALMALEFGIMYEVFVHAVKPYAGLIDLAKMLFGWAALFLLLAAGLTAFSTAGSHLTQCAAGIAYLDRGLRMMQCGILILFFLFERRLGLSWRSHSVSAALGLGIVAATGLCITFFRNQHPEWNLFYDLSENIVYFATVITWVICFRLPQPERKTVLDSPAKLIFQRWNDALLATPFVAQGGAATAQMDSFLPNVERTVDRVLARKLVN